MSELIHWTYAITFTLLGTLVGVIIGQGSVWRYVKKNGLLK